MNAIQTPNRSLLRVFRCPYCRHGRGDVHVDVPAAVAWKPPSDAEVVIGKVQQPVVVFRPGVVEARPCPHLLYLLLDVNQVAGDRRLGTKTFLWTHPWFDENKGEDDFASDLFFQDVFDHHAMPRARDERPVAQRFHPSVPYQVRRLWPEDNQPRNGHVQCEGWAVVTVDAAGFLAELRNAAALLPTT
jgi:hypothetical protein